MARRKPKYALLAIAVLLALDAAARTPASIRFDNLGISDGLLQSTVYGILQDRRGFMWFCTDGGVNRYDGYRFKTFRHLRGRKSTLPAAGTYTMYEDSSANLWAIDEKTLSLYHPPSESFRVAGILGSSQRASSHIIVETGGGIFFSRDGFLYRADSRTRRLTKESVQGCPDAFLLSDLRGGWLLMRGEDVLFAYHPYTRARRALPYAFPLRDISSAVPIGDSAAWLIDREGLVMYDALDGRVVKQARTPGHVLRRGAFDQNGLLWVGSTNGIICVDTASMQQRLVVSEAGNPFSLAGNDILSFCKDRSGILWIGTNDGGLSKLSYQKFKFGSLSGSAGAAPGLSGKSALSLAEDGEGRIWIGNEKGSINIFDPVRRALVRCDASTGCALRTSNYVLALLYKDGIMYCGHGDGVDAISTATRRVVATPLVENDVVIKKLFCDASGDLWAMGATALYKYDGKRHQFLPVPLPALPGRLQNIVDDDHGFLWMGVNNGLVRYDPASGKTMDYGRRQPGLFGDGTSTMALCKTNDGRVWAGVSEVGLAEYRERGDSFLMHAAKDFPVSSIYALAHDISGQLWFSTNMGVTRYNPATSALVNFTTADGLLSNEGIGRSVMVDSRHQLWIGNIAGVNVIDPAAIPVNAIAPIPQITGFNVFDRAIPFEAMHREGHGIRLKEAQNYFTIEYSAMDYTQPGENSYRIMLDGFDKGWRPLSKSNSVSYTNLDGGHYTFRLMAYNSDGVPSAAPLELPIYIAPHFYRTWWFYTLVGLLIGGGAYAFYRYRIGQLKRELRLRTTIASDLHDDVGATLSSIKMLTTMLKPKLRREEEASDVVDTIHQRAGTTLEAMSDIVWSINPKNDAGEHLVLRMKTYAAEALDDTDVDYRFVIGEDTERIKFPQQTRKDVYLIYKEALNNALKYAEASRIEIGVHREGQRLILEVKDDGKGFEPQALKATTRGGNGLKNMQGRAENIGGTLTVDSAPGVGTTLRLSLPIPHSR